MATTLSSGNGGSAVGFVRAVTGHVTATSSEGVTRVLQVGDMVFADEVIQTDNLGTILVEFNDGSSLALGGESRALIDNDVANFETSGEPSDVAASIEEIQAAIAAGEDPTAMLEAPAAGTAASTGPAGGGINVADVDRTADSTTPESGFETEGLEDSTVREPEFEGIDELLVGTAEVVGVTSEGIPTVSVPNDGTGVGGSDTSVVEDSTVSGGFDISTPDGLGSLTVGGTLISAAELTASGTTPILISGSNGQLTLNGFDGTTVSYSY
ncbi:MAG: retention module-containing protein, partial [Gammaproteobacteria bacterium]|nr:retention module-containing protein [Gammaproteobacteria bacterium]